MATKIINSSDLDEAGVIAALVPATIISLLVVGSVFLASRLPSDIEEYTSDRGRTNVNVPNDVEVRLVGGDAWDS